MTATPSRTGDRMLEKDWYCSTDTARAATYDLVEAVVQAGFATPSVHATMLKGTQCEWAGKGGVVMVLFDDSARCSLVTVRYGEDAGDVVDLPTTDQIAAALRTI
jgi:hypothetical protein